MRERTGKIKAAAFALVLAASVTGVSAQSGSQVRSSIPDSIFVVFQASCMPCHGAEGGRFPRARLNFARWKEYGASKEAEKSMLICSAIRKGSMPPKSARESRPEIIPTSGQIDMVCKWAQSLRPVKVRKPAVKEKM